jgi:hypothetical protein
MATETVNTTDAQRVEALASVLSDIAGDAFSLVELIHGAISDPKSSAAHLVAGAALAQRLGWMADRAAQVDARAGVQSSDEWLLCPATQQAMQRLGARA